MDATGELLPAPFFVFLRGVGVFFLLPVVNAPPVAAIAKEKAAAITSKIIHKTDPSPPTLVGLFKPFCDMLL